MGNLAEVRPKSKKKLVPRSYHNATRRSNDSNCGWAPSRCQLVPNDAGFIGLLMLRYAAMPTSDALIKCAICGSPISLEDAKVSEDGKPVHEECYVAKLRLGKHDPPQP